MQKSSGRNNSIVALVSCALNPTGQWAGRYSESATRKEPWGYGIYCGTSPEYDVMLCITFLLHMISFLYLHLHNHSWEVAFMIELEVRALKIFAHSARYIWAQKFCARLSAKISSKKCVNLWKICNIQWTNIFSVTNAWYYTIIHE